MWKLICLFSFFARALSAPSGCIEMCNSQSYQKLCCGLPMVVPSNDQKNWTDHKDFQTIDGALVHTKDGRYAHGNTHGSFSETSYYKEFGSGSNSEINQKLEDLTSSSQNSFESMFQSKFPELIQNFHESFNHLQELKKKGQIQTQECVYPCVPLNEQIAQLQQQLNTQQQHMQRMREEFWTRNQKQNTIVEPVEQVQVQQPVQSTYYPAKTVKQVKHHESYHNEETITHPHVTTRVTYQPVKYTSAAQQTHETESINQGYYGSSTSQQGSSRHNQGYGSSIPTQAAASQFQAGYEQHSGYGSSIPTQADVSQNPAAYGRTSYGSSNPTQAAASQIQAGYSQHSSYRSSTPTQAAVSQIQAGYGQHSRYGSSIPTQAVVSQIQAGYGQHSTYGSSIPTQAAVSQIQAGYRQHSGSGSQTFGSHSSHSSHSSYGVGFGSSDGSLTHGIIGMGPTPDCNDEAHHQSYSQIRRLKRHSPHLELPLHHRHHNRQEDLSQQLSDFQQVPQVSQDYSQQSTKIEDFGEPARIQIVSQKEIGTLGQQVEDIRHRKLQTQDIHQHSQDFAQQTEDLTQQIQDFTQQTHNLTQHTQDLTQQTQDFTQQSQQLGNDYYQQSRDFDDFSQKTEKLGIGQQKNSQHPEKIKFGKQDQQLPSQIPNLSQQNYRFDKPTQHQQHPSQIESLSQQTQDFSQQYQQHPSPIQSLSQQTQDFTQQQNHEFNDYSQHSGKLEFGQQNQQTESLSQQTQGFGPFPQPEKLEQGKEIQKLGRPTEIQDLIQQSQTVSDFSQHPRGFDQQTVGNLKLDRPAQDSLDFNQFQTSVLAPDSNQSGNQRFEGLNQQYLHPKPAPKPTSSPRNPKLTQLNNSNAERIFNLDREIQSPFENLRNSGRGDISAENEDSPTDQALTPHEISDTQEGYQQSFEDRYHKGDFGQQVQKPFSQQVQKPDQDFVQEVQKQSRDFSQEAKKPFDDFSQQMPKPRESYHQQVQKNFENVPQQMQKPFEDFSQQVQKPWEDFSQISDLSRNKDITQLPQEPKRGLTQPLQVQDKLTSHISSDISQQTQEISLGNQWHRSHNPGDLMNEKRFPDQFEQTQEQTQQRQQIQQREQTLGKREKDFIRFDQQSMTGKLELGKSVENQESDSQLRNERTTEMKLEPRILEAYGGRGPYDPNHSEDIFKSVRLNPSATLPPFIEGDPWVIREKPIISPVFSEDKVIPLDRTWVFPDSLPTISVTETPTPGFWTRVRHRFVGAYDKAKEKARDIFG